MHEPHLTRIACLISIAQKYPKVLVIKFLEQKMTLKIAQNSLGCRKNQIKRLMKNVDQGKVARHICCLGYELGWIAVLGSQVVGRSG